MEFKDFQKEGTQELSRIRRARVIRVQNPDNYVYLLTCNYPVRPGDMVFSDNAYYRGVARVKDILDLDRLGFFEAKLPYVTEAYSDKPPLPLMEICGTVLKSYNGEEESVEVPEGITELGDGCFEECFELKEIRLPKSLTKIGAEAFYACDNLEEVILPENVKEVGKFAFRKCGCERVVFLSKEITELPSSVFDECRQLKQITLPETLESIGGHAFAGCAKLKSIDLPDSLTQLGEGVFQFCNVLNQVTVPPKVTEIPQNTFFCCTSLKHVTLPEKLQKIGNSALCYCKALEEIEIPDSVTEIEEDAFRHCESLKSISIRDMDRLIGSADPEWLTETALKKQDPFSNPPGIQRLLRSRMRALTKRYMSEGNVRCLKNLLDLYVSMKPSYLEQLILWAQENAEVRAFLLQYRSERFTPEQLERERTIREEKAFGLRELTAADWKKIWSIRKLENGTLSIGNYRGEETELYIPEKIGRGTVTEIAREACEVKYASNHDVRARITQVVLPSTIRRIGAFAFCGCEMLTDINLPEHLRVIEGAAFFGCSSLKEITIPGSVKTVEEETFRQCTGLNRVILEPGVEKLEDTFWDSRDLREIVIPKSVWWFRQNMFYNCPKLVIYCEKDSYAYKYAKRCNIPVKEGTP